MRFLANENFPLRSVRILEEHGHDVTAVARVAPGAKDREVLMWASREQRLILTFDRDYGELVYGHKRPVPGGIVYFRFLPTSPEEPAEHVLRLLSVSGLSLQGRFTVVERGRVRQRPLPERHD